VISVVLPNFNHGQFIERAVEALISQDLAPAEIILIDDGSTDDSLTAIYRLREKFDQIQIIENRKNQGVIPTIQKGLNLARRRYVYFAAADDWVLPGFFSLAVRMLEAHPSCGLFCGDAILIDGETGQPLGRRPIVSPHHRPGAIDASGARRLLRRVDNWILTGSTLFRREAMLQNGGFDERLGSFADGYLARKIALNHGFCYAPQAVAVWRIFRGGVSRTTALNLANAQELLETVSARIGSDRSFPQWYAPLFCDRWRFATSRLAVISDPIDYSFVVGMAARSRMDRTIVTLLGKFLPEGLARPAILAWLWARLRPYRLFDIVRTGLHRRVAQLVGTRDGQGKRFGPRR
jgi:glycosyltransferase involved in cell wall biosynthesis